MDREARRRLEEYRRNEAGPLENSLIDEYADGEFDRRELLRRASVLGVSVPVVGAVLGALGEAPLAYAKPLASKAAGTRIRVAIIPPPAGAVEPSTLLDQGGLETC